ncbi:cytochrome c oxidase subunit II (mitochondrion) [Orbicella faveolata]|uniref:Cytochrome c oxidase subunit 2 n=3 Tax=Orbicella TaxID=1920453 RepID=Q4G6G4_ORBAN|nr:cytochrome c oxidase subunit II [Orbicella annularis]YP_271958.1 cytochrome c oxidase subunit II [Orbicella faveolata]BAE16211.1 cytochrome oxidase subunit II [Orbicella franksi]BAE16185.1 cytochrome oxidase subunit II [Orbicella annularis]BAE16198.1 cytochrome oxidase subunit II [Orbicella annularis]BAE16237.1 cytochrome oxidase subunit II [Orbicella faveolata]BAE16250.1 cytochrome oxidase subunit II [Orbicella faveolata]
MFQDGAEAWCSGLQDMADPVVEETLFFHERVMFLLVIIIPVVLWLIGEALKNKFYDRFLVDGTFWEIIWAIIPAVILVLIALPSLKLLYLMDEVVSPALTIKAVGHQWYWSYEYSDYEGETLGFDSYMLPTSDLTPGENRLLEVDNKLILPILTHIRLLVTGADVLHSFAVPSLGLKIDAVPGRLNQTGVFIKRPGYFFGQCSEICGANHSFMPIVIKGVWVEEYLHYLKCIINT